MTTDKQITDNEITKPKVARLRFAPSPTGFMHLGNFRTALFGYLLAKSLGGEFILRLEDTDQKREVAGALDKLLAILDWVGIRFDEGPHLGGPHAPYVQSERLAIYNEYCNQLLATGQAYRCFCSSERLTKMREEQAAKKQAPRYDGTCRDLSEAEITQRLSKGEQFVIRQKMPLDGEVVVVDELRGEIKFLAKDLDDQVLIKSNGVPTYHFASVVDDHLMEITHVTRGDEWLPSYPKNILLYRAFNWTPPKFIHLPLILNKVGGGKLSKRQGDVFLEQYKDQGYLPEALINFSALLGWHGKDDKEIYSLAELEKVFSLTGLGASPAVFDIEKLDYFNALYIRQKSLSELTDLTIPFLPDFMRNYPRQQLESFLALAQERMKRLNEAPELISFLFKLPDYDKSLLFWKDLTATDIVSNLQGLQELLTTVPETDWQTEELSELIFAWIVERGKKNGPVLWPLRVALSGLKHSPTPFEIASALGKTESLKRIQLALDWF
ncbi:MAG: glutamate--tRNA ligase [Patescibacteria group bacterium]|jgi:glutamyl-tRNA synthetase